MELIYAMYNAILITGFNGEIGRQTLLALSKKETLIIALDTIISVNKWMFLLIKLKK